MSTANPDTGAEPVAPTPGSDGARALAAAVSQIEVALREARAPVEQLGTVIGRMASTLASEVSWPAEMPQLTIEQLRGDLYDSIQQLQFYDRMVQHLSHVQDYLSCVANQLASDTTAEDKAEAWDRLRVRLRTRLISDAQRELLDLVLPPPCGDSATRQAALDDRARQGSVELF